MAAFLTGCQPKKTLGQECRRSDNDCAAGYYCDEEMYTCQPAAKEGEDCSPYYPIVDCASGLYCQFRNDTSYTYGCVAKKGPGEQCSDAIECQSGMCYSGYGCLASAECTAP